MKIKIAILALATTSVCFGATVNTSNYGGDTNFAASRPFYDNAGNALAGGTMFLGTWTGSVDPTKSPADVIGTNFSVWGGGISSPAVGFGQFDVTGTFEGGVTAPAGAFAGEAIAVWVGNAATIETSTEGFLMVTTETFPTDTDPAGLVNMVAGFGAPLLGADDVAGDLLIGGNDSGDITNGYGLAVLVPEPSSALLLGLGCFGFLVRRKR